MIPQLGPEEKVVGAFGTIVLLVLALAWLYGWWTEWHKGG